MKHMDKQQVIILLLGAVVLVGFGIFRYAPIIRTKAELKTQMTEQSLSMDQIQVFSRRLPELHQQKEQLLRAVRSNAGKIPEGKEYAQLWQQIAEVMNACQLENQLVQPEAEKRSDELCCVPLKIECTGTLQQIFTFFQSLEKFERLICFEEVQLKNDNDLSAMLKLNARANVYYKPLQTDGT